MRTSSDGTMLNSRGRMLLSSLLAGCSDSGPLTLIAGRLPIPIHPLGNPMAEMRFRPVPVLVALWLLVPSIVSAQGPTVGTSREGSFLEALRQRGYFEYAQLYLDELEKSSVVPAEIKAVISYERAITFLEAGRRAARRDGCAGASTSRSIASRRSPSSGCGCLTQLPAAAYRHLLDRVKNRFGPGWAFSDGLVKCRRPTPKHPR